MSLRCGTQSFAYSSCLLLSGSDHMESYDSACTVNQHLFHCADPDAATGLDAAGWENPCVEAIAPWGPMYSYGRTM